MLQSIHNQTIPFLSSSETANTWRGGNGEIKAQAGHSPLSNKLIALFNLPAQLINLFLSRSGITDHHTLTLSTPNVASNGSLLQYVLKKCLATGLSTMAILNWLTLLPLLLLAKVIAVLLAPLLPLFANDSGYLPDWLWWFQTPDNSLDGDNGWKQEHWQWRYQFPASIAQYIGRVGWLMRNPSYGFSTGRLAANVTDKGTITGNPKVSDNPYQSGYRYIKSGKYFEFYGVWPTFAGKCLRMRLRWKLDWPINSAEKAQYVCSINPFKTRRS